MDGLINLFKSKDFTSHDALNIIRRYFPGTKIGHGGTLDPAATGVLPVCLGKATKLQDLIMSGDKCYEADIVFGVDSFSLDLSGEYDVVDDHFLLTEDALKKVLASFIGVSDQLPPLVSAIKQQGVPLYKRARRGETVAVEPRRIEIYELTLKDIINDGSQPRARIFVHCSKGTYIRSLARDIGKAMGTAAVVDRLTRLSSGRFSAENAVTLAEFEKRAKEGDLSFVMPMEEALKAYPRYDIDDAMTMKALSDGKSVSVENMTDGRYVIYEPLGSVFALGCVDNGWLKTDSLLFSARKRQGKMKNIAAVRDLDTSGGSAVVIGNFDGVHLGHQLLIDRCVKEAERAALSSVVLTFSPHPRIFFGDPDQKSICTDSDKAARIDALGADVLLTLPFDEKLASLQAEDFIGDILCKGLNAKKVFVGDDFTFGKEAKGSSRTLAAASEKGLFDLFVAPLLCFRGEEISSTRVKKLLAAGNVTEAGRILGRPYSLKGEVVHGKEVGRGIGFPTANIDFPEETAAVKSGVYIASVNVDGKKYAAVTSVGHRPTVSAGQPLNVESHLLDFEGDLYGKMMTVTLISYLREEKKFDSLESLKEAIAADKEKAENFFEKRKNSSCNRKKDII